MGKKEFFFGDCLLGCEKIRFLNGNSLQAPSTESELGGKLWFISENGFESEKKAKILGKERNYYRNYLGIYLDFCVDTVL